MRSFCAFVKKSDYGENKARRLCNAGLQLLTGEEIYQREFGNLKLIKDNYPKFVVSMEPNVGLIHDAGIVACSARQFLLNAQPLSAALNYKE